MNDKFFYGFLLFGVISFIDMLVDNFCQSSAAKACNYDCSKCSNWRCYSDYCKRKRGEE